MGLYFHPPRSVGSQGAWETRFASVGRSKEGRKEVQTPGSIEYGIDEMVECPFCFDFPGVGRICPPWRQEPLRYPVAPVNSTVKASSPCGNWVGCPVFPFQVWSWVECWVHGSGHENKWDLNGRASRWSTS